MCLLKNEYTPSALTLISWVSDCRLAKTEHYDSDELVDIYCQYGDHLYSKGDYNAAIQQYIKTIGKREAAYVIRKVKFPYNTRRMLDLKPENKYTHFYINT